MKIKNLGKKLAILAVAGVALPVSVGLAQSVPTPGPAQPAPVSAPAVPLSSGAQQVLQLSQAKISDDTIIAFIKSSMINYNLNANEIIYLRQQGISNPVITAMLNQSGPASASAATTAAVTPPTATTVSTDTLPVYTAPVTTEAEPAPDAVYDDDSYYYPYYDPYYYPGYYPGGVYIGGGWGWGGGWHGHGDWHGGGFHGGGFHGGGGGGFHGGGGGRR